MSIEVRDGLGLPAAEPQEARPVEVSPHRPENPVATVLERAALYIEEFGWVQRRLGGRAEGFCALGAIFEVSANGGSGFEAGMCAAKVTGLNTPGTKHPLAVFNDAPGRTAAEVTAALREAARRVRDAGEVPQ